MENMPGMGGTHGHDQMQHSMTHMTFFWGKNSEILFSGWPGTRTGMYVLALIVVFLLSVVVEWFSGCRWAIRTDKSSDNISAGLIKTILHGVRIGLAYLVMLALMSYNIGVFIVAIAGHVLGFFLFRSGAFDKYDGEGLSC